MNNSDTSLEEIHQKLKNNSIEIHHPSSNFTLSIHGDFWREFGRVSVLISHVQRGTTISKLKAFSTQYHGSYMQSMLITYIYGGISQLQGKTCFTSIYLIESIGNSYFNALQHEKNPSCNLILFQNKSFMNMHNIRKS